MGPEVFSLPCRRGAGRIAAPTVKSELRTAMRNTLGIVLQFLALVFLPMLIVRQLATGFELIWMPSLLLAGVLVFYAGHLLREKES